VWTDAGSSAVPLHEATPALMVAVQISVLVVVSVNVMVPVASAGDIDADIVTAPPTEPVAVDGLTELTACVIVSGSEPVTAVASVDATTHGIVTAPGGPPAVNGRLSAGSVVPGAMVVPGV
jgi:hypothetical protein